MNTEELTAAAQQMGMEQGKQEATLAGIHKTIDILHNLNQNDERILEQLKLKYGDSFSNKQLEDFLKQN